MSANRARNIFERFGASETNCDNGTNGHFFQHQLRLYEGDGADVSRDIEVKGFDFGHCLRRSTEPL